MQENTDVFTHMMCRKTCYCTLSCMGIQLFFSSKLEEGRRLHPSMDCRVPAEQFIKSKLNLGMRYLRRDILQVGKEKLPGFIQNSTL